ncbi:MAG TPA: ABC transporter substrate binding protein [Pyrinomonadaceae bacterium]|nr:ABC transporter substrate binding protein [Pyrinomonadaceae bacterium]
MTTKTRAVMFAEGRSTAQVVLMVFAMTVSFAASTYAQVSEKHKSVLVVFSEESSLHPQIIAEQAIRSTLKNGSSAPIEIYTEYLDALRTPVNDYENELLTLLRRKYEGRKLDLIIAVSSTSVRVLSQHQAEIFPDTPVVFMVLDQRHTSGLNLASNWTGIWGELNFKPNLNLALALHPGAKKVVVLGGVSNFDKFVMDKLRQDFLTYEGQLEISYLIGLTVPEQQQAVAGLPPSTIVVLAASSRDNAGNNFSTLEVLRQIAPTSTAPIYGVTDAQLGAGIVGGSVLSFEALGSETARVGLRILAGEKPQAIAPHAVPNLVMFDWRQLRRWAIDENKLPAGSIVRYREPSIWELYKWRIIGAIALFILQTLLIIVLLLNRAKRRRAEEEVRLSEARFRDMADSSAILIWIADENMLCTYFNKRACEFTGRPMDQLVGEGWLDIVHEEERQPCMDAYTAGYESRKQFVLEYRILGADGEYHWIYDTGAPRFAANGELLGYIGSAVDITDRRNAEEALQIAHEEVNKLKNQLEAENIYLKEEIRVTHNVDEIVGESNVIKYVLYKIEQVAQTDTGVLILGETGTGKELVARAIHSQSIRKDRPLVRVNCAALSASLIESELFGHEKGAFTGATARKIGRFELADGATIFLDEIGELPLELQPKLLRIIQEGELERLGSAKTIKVDVRLIAATNRNLKEEVEKGAFREDLWYRLNVFPITLPPLRQRKEDIPLMVEHFTRMFSKKVGKSITSVSSATMKKFQEHSWPGNVRELSNVVERALVTASGSVLHVVEQFEHPKDAPDLAMTLEEIERDHIIRVLDQTSWRVEGPSGAARILGLNPSTLRTRMGKLGIQKSIRSFAQSSKRQNN